jgi:hypothetical protein
MNYGTYSFPKKSYDFDMDTEGTVALVAASTIQSGDIVFNTLDGAVSLQVPQPVTSTIDNNSTSPIYPVELVTPSSENAIAICTLVSGDTVVVTSTATAVKFSRYNSSGVLQGSITTVETLSSVQTVDVAALTGGSFVIAYGYNVAGVKFAQYSSTGTLVGSITNIQNPGQLARVAVAPLTSGNFVVIWGISGGGASFAQYTTANALVGSVTSPSWPGGASSSSVAVAGLTNGNFVVIRGGGSSGSVEAYQYNSSNTIIGSVITLQTNLTTYSYVGVTGLENGSFALVYQMESNQVRYRIYNTSNTLIYGDVVLANGNNGWLAVRTLANGNFVVVYQVITGTQPVYYTQLTPLGAFVGLKDNLVGTSAAGSGLSVAGFSDSSFAIAYCNAAGHYFTKFNKVSAVLPALIPQLDTTLHSTQYSIQSMEPASTTNGRVASTLLANDCFVVAYGTNNESVRLSIRHPTGQLKVGPISIDKTNTNTQVSLCTLANGNFVLAFMGVSQVGNYPKFVQYTPEGVRVGSITTVEASSVNSLAITALNGGGFVIAYLISSNVLKFNQYDSTGTIVGSTTTVASSITNPIAAATLTNGNFVIAYQNATNAFFAIYNTSNQQLISSNADTATITSPYPIAVVSLPSSNFAISWFVTNARFAIFAPSGVRVGAVITPEVIGTVAIALGVARNGNVLCLSGGKLHQYTLSGNLVGSVAVGGSGTTNVAVAISTLTNGSIVSTYTLGSVTNIIIHTPSARYVSGVALNNASVGDYVRVRYIKSDYRAGSFSTRETFGVGLSFDHRSLGGIAGTISSKTLFSRGLAS